MVWNVKVPPYNRIVIGIYFIIVWLTIIYWVKKKAKFWGFFHAKLFHQADWINMEKQTYFILEDCRFKQVHLSIVVIRIFLSKVDHL